ncbi:MAG: DUF2080 family transposase-associated protein [Nanoarchaeota archaeon]|nr:DUF2080 family transposase-associated protein [Nanoarchaeota archaeon]
MEITRNVSRWGNGAGILLPKEWVGKEAKVILIDRTLQIKKEVFDILSDYLEGIIGIYLVGSYARNEQTESSDIDIIAISKDTRKEIISGKYHLSIVTLEGIKRVIKKNPILILPRLYEAKPILNNSLLEEITSTKIRKESFKGFIEETSRIIKINKGLLQLEEKYSDLNIIYSLILRLRGIFLIKNILEKKKYSNKLFLRWLFEELKESINDLWEGYKIIKEDKKTKINITIEKAKKLLSLLEKEVKEW